MIFLTGTEYPHRLCISSKVLRVIDAECNWDFVNLVDFKIYFTTKTFLVSDISLLMEIYLPDFE